MRTHLEFTSSAFPAQPEEDDDVNPGVFGKLLASYIRDELIARGLSAKEPFAEDWGWLVSIENRDFPVWVGCSANRADEPTTFQCIIEPSKPVVRKLFRKFDTTERVEAVAAALDAALRKHPGVRELRWIDNKAQVP